MQPNKPKTHDAIYLNIIFLSFSFFYTSFSTATN